MTRKSVRNSITASSFTLSGPSPSRSSHSSLPAGESLSLNNPYVLHEHVPSQTSHSKRHRREASRLGPGSAGGSGKDGRSGKTGVGGGDKSDSDDSSSGQDDEDTDDDDDDDDDDGDDVDEPAVDGPVRVSGERAASMKLTPADGLATEGVGIIANGDHRTGQHSRKRTFGADMDGVAGDGNGQDYPRKKKATRFMLDHDDMVGSATTLRGLSSDGIGGDNKGGVYIGPGDEEEEDEEIEEEDIEKEEEAAIIRELEDDTEPETPIEPDTLDIIHHLDFISGDEFEDLNDEVFSTQWNDPGFFTDIPCDPTGEFSMFHGDDLFSEDPSVPYTPAATPANTPRPSFSTAPPSRPPSPCERKPPPSSRSSEPPESDDPSALNPFFGSEDPVLKHLVSTQPGGWADGTDEEGDNLWENFFTSESSGEESDVEDEGEETEEGCSEAELEGETTDEEEDLPMPTPQSKSILRRVSFDEPQSPQVIHMDRASRPRLGSWVADPSRPICVVDGSKKTYLVPKGQRLSISADTNNGSISNHMVVMEEDSESDRASIVMKYNPTLPGLTGGDNLFLNGSDILGPPEAFYPYINEDGELVGDGLPEDDLDEFEAGLQITDFLQLSSSDEEGDDENLNKSCLDGSDGAADEIEEECVPAVDSSVEMLSRWDKVSVTAFRKRQIQHAQKTAAEHHGNPNSSPSSGYGLHKIKEGRLAETITPADRKKKSKRKCPAGGRGLGASAAMRKKISNKRSEELGWNLGGNRHSPFYESFH